MKILHVIPSYRPSQAYGGPTIAIADLCEGLVRSGHEVVVYTSNANGKEDLDVICGKEYFIAGVKIIYHPRWTKDHSNFSPGLILRFWRTAKHFNVIHISSWWNLITMPVAMTCYLKGIHPVFSVHGALSNFTFNHRKQGIKRLVHALFGKSLLNFGFIHVTSAKEKAEVEVNTSAYCFIIANIITFPDRVEAHLEKDDSFNIIFLGRIDPVKNIEFIIDVLDKRLDMPFALKIFGDGEEKYINSLKLKSGDSGKISWCGYIDYTEKWKQLAEADLLLLPSQTENFGNVVVEALSQGTPVLISDQVGLKDFVEKNRLGWVVKLKPEIWRDILLSIWRDSTTRDRIRKEGPEIIHEKFGAQKLIDQYVELYQRSLHG